MSTTELFKKHFGDTGVANLNHPNAEAFFEDLNKECQAEDKRKSNPYLCCVCHATPVNPEEGYDTCDDCLSRI